MQKQFVQKTPQIKMKKVSVGRMLIAMYVLVVLALSATAKAAETFKITTTASCF